MASSSPPLFLSLDINLRGTDDRLIDYPQMKLEIGGSSTDGLAFKIPTFPFVFLSFLYIYIYISEIPNPSYFS